MDCTRTKVEVIKPVLLKAGIPLAISVAGLILARLTTRMSSAPKASNSENQESRDEDRERLLSPDSNTVSSMEEEEEAEEILTCTHFTNPLASWLMNRDKGEVEEEVLGLRRRIEELQDRESQLEKRFIKYCNMKEQESVLRELQNNVLLEMVQVEFLGKEVSSMEAESRRFEELVMGHLIVLEQLENSREENRLLRRKVKKLSRKTQRLSWVIRGQNLQIEEKETEISRNQEELERKDYVVKALENEITELQTVLGQLQQEKEELLKKLELAENSASPKPGTGGITIEDYNHVVNELEQLQKDRAAEVKELIYQRWCNACLRHELMRRSQEQKEDSEAKSNHLELDFGGNSENGDLDLGSDHELDGLDSGHGNSCFRSGHGHSKRRKLIQKLKKWVEGSDQKMNKQRMDEKEKNEIKCLRRSLALYGAEDRHLSPRNSCSSA